MDNPLASPYFPATAWRLGAVLSLVVVALLVRHRRTVRTGGRSALAAKALTVVWVAPVLLLAVFVGGALLLLVVAAVLVQSLREYAALVRLGRGYTLLLVGYSLATASLGLLGRPLLLLVLPLGLFLAATAVPIVSGRVDDAHRQMGAVLFGYLFIGLALSCIVLVRQAEGWGLQFLIVVGTAIALADAGAYLFGNWLGGPKLARTVSPNKTWSGVAGSLFGVAAGLALQSPVMPGSWGPATVGALLGVITLGAVWGDLAESVVKRDVGVKDAGTVLPGFGGLLDRFDSFFLTVPLAFATLLLIS